MVGTVIAEFGFMPGVPGKNEMPSAARREVLKKRFGDYTDELITLFKKAYPGKNETDLLYTDSMFRPATIKYAEMKSAVASAPVYSYIFALDFDYDDGKAAWHCSDIPFFFRNTELVPICNIEGVTERLEDEMAGAFVQFARSGNPNHKAMADWPQYTPDNKATMIFDRVSSVRVDHEAELLALLKKASPPFDMGAMRNDDADEDDDTTRAWLY